MTLSGPSPVRPFAVNMDLTLDGYIRLFSHQGQLKWSSSWATSSMSLVLTEDSDNENDEDI